VCVALLGVVGIIIGDAVVTTLNFTTTNSARAVAHSQTREILEPTVRLLRAAKPLGHCLEDGSGTYSTPLTGCTGTAGKHVEETGAPLASATASQVCFYSFGSPTVAADTDVLRPPDEICLGADPASGSMTAATYPHGASATYTTCAPASCFATSASVARLYGTLANPGSVFSYFDATGAPIAAPVTGAALANVAIVKAVITLTFPTYGQGTNSYSVSYLAALEGNRFEREQSWQGA